jgi:hypothetical protein
MRSFLTRYNYFFLLVLIFVLCEAIVNPIGNFPLNDDWCYGKAAYSSSVGDYTIGRFGAMTLFTHLMWGILFIKIFGFSFTVLRISTLLSAIIGCFFLNKIIIDVTQNKQAGFFACLVLLFNPLYFNLSNTFMTDVNFNTLLIVCCYCAFVFFHTKRFIYLALFFVLAAFLVLLRQFGIIMPLCFTLACFGIKEKKWLTLGLSVIGTLAVYTTLRLYENYLVEIAPEGSAYKFSGSVHLSDKIFWKTLLFNFTERYRTVLLHLFIYTAPFAAIYLPALIKNIKMYVVLLMAAFSFCLVFWFFKDVKFPFQNIFENMSLGPETFYESFKTSVRHTYSESFGSIMELIKYIFSGITLISLFLLLVSMRQNRNLRLSLKTETVFLISLVFTYTFMILITESYFDRYHIPLITLALIFMARIYGTENVNYKIALIPLLCIFYVSVFGTKDYLTLNRLRWEAYSYLKEEKHTTIKKVNGGVELNSFNDMNDWWEDYFKLSTFDYLIQFKKEDGFTLLKEYEFQRYFPYKKDKINIFVKEAINNPGLK